MSVSVAADELAAIDSSFWSLCHPTRSSAEAGLNTGVKLLSANAHTRDEGPQK